MVRTKPPRQTLHRVKGSALITVTVIGLFVMLGAAALVNQFAIAEANAIAHSLAKTRIYWASMGHINYGLSRVQREGLCGGDCVADEGATPAQANRAVNLRNFLNELGGEREWDFGEGYKFNIGTSVIDGPLPVPDNNDGRVRVTIELKPISGSSFDVLNGIEQRIRKNVVVDVCLAADPACSSGNSSSSGANLIEELRRQ